MQFEVSISGTPRLVEVVRRDEGLQFELDGEPIDVDLREVQPGRYSAKIGHRQQEVFLLRDGERALLTSGAATIDARVVDTRRRLSNRGGVAGAADRELRTLIPGKVVRILVSEGQTVQPEDGIVVVEAMKMENELRCGQPSLVERVLVEPGQLVEAGAVLVRLQPLS